MWEGRDEERRVNLSFAVRCPCKKAFSIPSWSELDVSYATKMPFPNGGLW